MTDTLPALEDDPLRHARHLVRAATKASLATLMAKPDEGAPYASLVIIAADHDGAPLLLLSDLAEHSANIARNGRVSLLIDGTAGFEDPLTGPRVSVTGVARRSREARHRTRYLARHPSAERYADFGDFAFYRLAVERAHLVAGFGRIAWVEPFLLALSGARALIESEAGIVEHMNADHGDALSAYAEGLLGLPAGAWSMTGIDPEGCDLRCDNHTARVAFERQIADPGEARAVLVALAKAARAQNVR